MKKLTKLVASIFAVFLLLATSVSAQEAKIESYAHPTLFNNTVETTINTDNTEYVVGGKIIKDSKKVSLKNKENVLVNAWVKDILNTIKVNTDRTNFNVKMPVLRSELAVILSEGLSINKTTKSYYTDITEKYWAKSWINRALAAKIMIGYPDKTFRPDQPVTKAEVFATIATLIDVPTDRSLIVPSYKGKQLQFVPKWAIAPAKEVVASDLLAQIPDQDKMISNEYLTTEQVAYLVGALRQYYIFNDKNAGKYVGAYKPVKLEVKLTERLSAKVSNVGDKFVAKTVCPVTLAGKTFPANSEVIGQIVNVSRPGYKKEGFIEIKFLEIKSENQALDFPKNLEDATATKCANANVIARLLGFPFSSAARVVGVAGRSVGTGVNIAANDVEQYGDRISNTFVNTAALQPKAGLRSFGNSFVTVGKGIYDVSKIAVSGTFGVLYELGDEITYVVLPSKSANSTLNAGDVLTIIY